GEITLQGKARVMADGAGYLNDVSNYQIVCMEGAKPVDDDKKNIKRMNRTMLDFRGTYRLFEVDRFSLPKDWVDMPKFTFMYEALI
ncbi:4679_t:CDS:2, partial [Paraglomus occultum]